jgi:ABC-type polysaccharide/polyol phosphate export permease
MQNAINFFRQIGEKRYLLYQLTKRDFVQKYVESYLGLTWAIFEPLATTVILSIIFTFGFKSGPVQDIPFFLYMFSGMVAFNYFSMATSEGTNVIRSYSFLVKKINFRLSILPIVKALSCTIFHVIMLGLLLITLLAYGYYPSIYWLQFIYYFFAMNVLVLGVSWLTSSISVFVPDVRHIVSICLQFLFYLSPIFWSIDNIPDEWAFLPKLNPMYYIINGYRDTFIYHKPFWIHLNETIYYWLVSLAFLFLGTFTFRRLRPHFADVV